MTDSTSEPRDEGPEGGADNLDPDLAPTIASDGSRSSDSAARASVPGVEHPGSCIGPYTLVEPLGEGGFGTVWRARQEEPVKREVALKVIKPGRDTAEVVARFEQERQALAVMDHPNIARVFDAGTTHSGRPYFVMEIVEGQPITEYCDENRLTIAKRLELFIPVCRAVQHAHSKGIIHRDLKPSNVIVVSHDGNPVPKVIDFGIAKAMEQQLSEDDTFKTLEGVALGTPVYMSPEQISAGTDVDTRADVYSLGALLYELLTGTPPIDPKDLKAAGYAGMEQLICEGERPRPSDRTKAMDKETAQFRRVDTSRLVKSIRGDLDWIALKALEKDRERRYETANALAAELRRHLNHEPVVAGPPSASYRLGKFVRKRKGPLSAVAALFVVLVAGIAASLWQARVAEKEAVRATKAEWIAEEKRIEAEKATTLAEERADTIQRNLYFAEMNLAAQSAQQGSGMVSVSELTAKWLPNTGELDYRNWEWFYLDSLTRNLVAILRGHTGFIEAVSWSPDGSRIASGARDMTIRISESKSGKCVHTLRGNQGWIKALAWSPDGQKIASGEVGGLIRVWEAKNGKMVAVLEGHQGEIERLQWSPDGKSIASSDSKCSVRVWGWDDRVTHWSFSEEVKDPAAGRFDVSWSPDNRKLAVAGGGRGPNLSGEIRLLDASTGEEVGRCPGWARRVRWRPDGNALAISSGAEIRLFDFSANSITHTLTGHRTMPTDFAWSPDGKYLASASALHFVKIWDLENGEEAISFRGHRDRVNALSWSPYGRFLVSAGNDLAVRIWDVENQLRRKHSDVSGFGGRLDLSWSPDDRKFLVAGWKALSVVDAKTEDVVQTFSWEDALVDVCAWSPNGKWAAAGFRDGGVRVWEIDSGRLIQESIHLPFGVRALAWRPGSAVLAAGSKDRLILFDVEANEKMLEDDSDVKALAWDPSGNSLACLLGTGFVLRDGKNFRKTYHGPIGHGEGRALSWNPNGTLVASVGGAYGGGVPEILIRNSETGEITKQIRGCQSRIKGVDWSPDGSRIVTGEDDGTVRVWDVASASQTISIQAHLNNVNDVEWSPDGRMLVSCGHGERGVRIWDAIKGYEAEEQRRKEAETP